MTEMKSEEGNVWEIIEETEKSFKLKRFFKDDNGSAEVRFTYTEPGVGVVMGSTDVPFGKHSLQAIQSDFKEFALARANCQTIRFMIATPNRSFEFAVNTSDDRIFDDRSTTRSSVN